MNRTCCDTGIIFYCCIFVTIMGVLGRPISIDFLRESLADKYVLNQPNGDSENGVSEDSRRYLLGELSSELFPLFQTSEEENDSSAGQGHLPSNSVNGGRTLAISNTPEYMLELYNKLSNNKPFLHNSNIIRSFMDFSHQDIRTTTSASGEARKHSLTFNISTLDHRESINLAELRLYTLIKRDQSSFVGVRRFVSVFEVLNITNDHKTREKYNYITSKFINSVENAWESFDVTPAVKRSLEHGSKIEKLEVRIRSLFSHHIPDNLDINYNPNDAKQPILVVYSNDNSLRHEHSVDRHELVMHSIDTVSDLNSKYATPLSSSSVNMYTDNQHIGNHERVKRSRLKNSICRRRPMYVNFADIGFDWIIAPRGYQAYQCAGRCYFPLSDQMHTTKHAIIQLLVNVVYPRRATRVCCVPTKLEPISILYVDEYGIVTYKYSYDGMAVSECGCR